MENEIQTENNETDTSQDSGSDPSNKNAGSSKGKKQKQLLPDGRQDVRLPLDPDLADDLKKLARITADSRIALLTRYVREGYFRDLEEKHLLLQSRGFNPSYPILTTQNQNTHVPISPNSMMPPCQYSKEELEKIIEEVSGETDSTSPGCDG